MRNLEDLMKRYGIAKSSLSEFIKNHITEINNDGQNHIVTDKKVKWFDDYAVQRIDELRGYNSNVTLAAEAAKADRERELLEENSQLKTRLLLMAEEKAQVYKELAEYKGYKLLSGELQTLAEEAKSEQKAAEAAAEARLKQAAEIEAAAHRERQQHDAEKAEAARKLNEAEARYEKAVEINRLLQDQLATERKKTWLDKLFGR
jgi:DNA repair exonuclease SbcCD ATPase subunit